MFVAICADLGECVMERRKSKIGTVKVKFKRDANGRLVRVDDDLVQIGGAKEIVRVKVSSRHGMGCKADDAGLGAHQFVKDASGRLVVCDNIGNVLTGTRINSIDTASMVRLWEGHGILSVSFAIMIEPREFLKGLMQYPNRTSVDGVRIYPSRESTKFAVGCRVDKILQSGLSYDNLGMILYFSRVREVTHRLTAMVSFEDRLLTLTGDSNYVMALVSWLTTGRGR